MDTARDLLEAAINDPQATCLSIRRALDTAADALRDVANALDEISDDTPPTDDHEDDTLQRIIALVTDVLGEFPL